MPLGMSLGDHDRIALFPIPFTLSSCPSPFHGSLAIIGLGAAAFRRFTGITLHYKSG